MTVAEARTLYGQIAEVGGIQVWFCVWRPKNANERIEVWVRGCKWVDFLAWRGDIWRFLGRGKMRVGVRGGWYG
jgi:hypothetical protein